MTGKELCEITHKDFKTKIPTEFADIFWTHFELLRKHKYVAIITEGQNQELLFQSIFKKTQKPSKSFILFTIFLYFPVYNLVMQVGTDNRIGNNGQIQLWQFLLEILTDKEYCNVIEWIGTEYSKQFE